MSRKPATELYDVEGVIYEVVEADGLDGFGECDTEKAIIKVARQLAPAQKSQTKRHEFSHAAFWESGAWHHFERTYGRAIADAIDEDLAERVIPVYNHIKRIR